MLSSGSPVGLVGGQSSNMQQASSSVAFAGYGDRPQMGLDVEFGADPASGAFFQTDGRKHEDLKQMLDSNKDGLKLEAMKRIIGMIARGRDASDLFPAVVKNVVSKNIEVKKLVYVYLVRYAEEQQDLALLSISTFQRALKDPNQLIRASALRVLSSIRVSMIVPIVMLAIRDSASDMSPYVRKTAAHAIPKLYSLDDTQKDELVTVIDKLLSDRTTLVVGSAVMAFDEVCPERVDLIHKNYRKLCNLLVDVDEWGQVIIINMLTRYARTQFLDPNADEVDENDLAAEASKQKFYDDVDENASSSSDNEAVSTDKKTTSKNKPSKKRRSSSTTAYVVDLDHRLLLRQTKPLLQSRNASVVMAVAQLYHHIAPRHEVQIIAKALVRLLRSHKEVQSVVLTCIASMSIKRKAIFESYIKSFFVRTSDPTHIKLLKLDILTNLASASSISLILREFQTYISSNDRSFVAATIQAIGRCAASIKEVTETCLNGLVQLLSNRDEHVVAESVVVIKKLLQTKAAEHYEIISRMAKLLDFITVPAARSSIIWLIGEYNEKVPKIAPDVLRKMAKTFVDEEDVVKLQVLNLGVKLYLNNPEQTSLLVQYVFTLARYDANYDIRDRARLLKQFILPVEGKSNILSEKAHAIFLSTKPAPAVESKWRDRNNYQLGTLSHYLSMRATGYTDLPDFPTVAPDSSVRNIEGFMTESTALAAGNNGVLKEQTLLKLNTKDKDFYATSDKSSTYTDTETSASSNSSDESASCAEDNAKESKKSNEKHSKLQEIKKVPDLIDTRDNEGTSDSDGESTSGEESSSDSEDDSKSYGSDSESQSGKEEEEAKKTKTCMANNNNQEKKSNMDLLLDLDDMTPMGPVMTPSLGGFLTPGFLKSPTATLTQNDFSRIDLVSPSYVELKHKELLNKLSGHGLQVGYRFTRAPHLYSASMVSIELQFINQSQEEIINIQVGQKILPSGMQMNEFAPVMRLLPQQLATSILGVDFNDSTHAIDFELISSVGKSRINLKPPVGELIRSVLISETYFREECSKLRGMNEHQTQLALKVQNINMAKLQQKVVESTNVAKLPVANNSNNEYKLLHFVGQTMTSKSLVLISLDFNSMESLTITVNCEKMVIGSMILNELRNALTLAFK